MSEVTRNGQTINERMAIHDIPELNIMLGDIAECLGDAGSFLTLLRIASNVDRETPNGAEFLLMIRRMHHLSCMILEGEL